MSLLVVGLSHRSAPVSVLERAALSRGRADQAAAGHGRRRARRRGRGARHLQPHRAVRRRGQVPRGCRRAVHAARPAQRGRAWTSSRPICTCTTRTGPSTTCSRWPAGWTRWSSARARSSARSRTRSPVAQELHTAGRLLNDLFQQALRVGKRAHTETGIDRAGQSLVTFGLEQLAAGARRRGPGPRASGPWSSARAPCPRSPRRPSRAPVSPNGDRQPDARAGRAPRPDLNADLNERIPNEQIRTNRS